MGNYLDLVLTGKGELGLTCRAVRNRWQLAGSTTIQYNIQYNITLAPSVSTLIVQGMFCGAKYTHHTFTPIIKHLITTTAYKHPGKKSFIDNNMKILPLPAPLTLVSVKGELSVVLYVFNSSLFFPNCMNSSPISSKSLLMSTQ